MGKNARCACCGQPALTAGRGDNQIVLCCNPQCMAYDPQQMQALAQAALRLRVKAIGFGEFKRIVDTNVKR